MLQQSWNVPSPSRNYRHFRTWLSSLRDTLIRGVFHNERENINIIRIMNSFEANSGKNVWNYRPRKRERKRNSRKNTEILEWKRNHIHSRIWNEIFVSVEKKRLGKDSVIIERANFLKRYFVLKCAVFSHIKFLSKLTKKNQHVTSSV